MSEIRTLSTREPIQVPKAPRRRPASRSLIRAASRRGTNGVSNNRVTAHVMFFDRGTFRVLPLIYGYLPKSARAYLFLRSGKIHELLAAAAPLVLTPFVRNPCEHECIY